MAPGWNVLITGGCSRPGVAGEGWSVTTPDQTMEYTQGEYQLYRHKKTVTLYLEVIKCSKIPLQVQNNFKTRLQ